MFAVVTLDPFCSVLMWELLLYSWFTEFVFAGSRTVCRWRFADWCMHFKNAVL